MHRLVALGTAELLRSGIRGSERWDIQKNERRGVVDMVALPRSDTRGIEHWGAAAHRSWAYVDSF